MLLCSGFSSLCESRLLRVSSALRAFAAPRLKGGAGMSEELAEALRLRDPKGTGGRVGGWASMSGYG